MHAAIDPLPCGHGSSIRLVFDNLCRAKNIEWSMAVELLVAVAAVGSNS